MCGVRDGLLPVNIGHPLLLGDRFLICSEVASTLRLLAWWADRLSEQPHTEDSPPLPPPSWHPVEWAPPWERLPLWPSCYCFISSLKPQRRMLAHQRGFHCCPGALAQWANPTSIPVSCTSLPFIVERTRKPASLSQSLPIIIHLYCANTGLCFLD